MKYPIVTEDDHGIRPAGQPNQCFYCGSFVGEEHKHGCVMVTKRVRVKATVYYDVEVPYGWNSEDIYFRYNQGTWCASNMASDIEQYVKNTGSCMCEETEVEYVKDVDDTPMVVPTGLRKIGE